MAPLPSHQMDSAVERGKQFLASIRCEDGLWRDFRTRAGLSSEWVTAFVAYALRQAGNGDSVSSVLTLLAQRQRSNGGWAYNSEVPTDCDSTAWAVLGLSADPQGNRPSIEKGIEYILRHQDQAKGGFSTYAPSDQIETFIHMPGMASIQGWIQPHSCVTGVALQALLNHKESVSKESIEKAVQYLLLKRQPSGLWRSYWWNGWAYGTYHALRALKSAGAMDLSQQVEAGMQIQEQYRADWNAAAFETAFTLLGLLLSSDPAILKVAERLALWLIGQQKVDGSWPTAPILRIPPPASKEPDNRRSWSLEREGTGVMISDQRGSFTTAAVIWALATYRSVQ